MTPEYWKYFRKKYPRTAQKYMDAGLRWQELRTCDCCDKVLFTKKQERIFAIFEVGVAPDEVVRTLKAIATETENRLADPSRNQVILFSLLVKKRIFGRV